MPTEDANVIPVSVIVRGLHTREVSKHGDGGMPQEWLHPAAQVRSGREHLAHETVRGTKKRSRPRRSLPPLGLRQGPATGAGLQVAKEKHTHITMKSGFLLRNLALITLIYLICYRGGNG